MVLILAALPYLLLQWRLPVPPHEFTYRISCYFKSIPTPAPLPSATQSLAVAML